MRVVILILSFLFVSTQCKSTAFLEKSGYLSNEALPSEANDKETEKKQTYYEKHKTLKNYQPPAVERTSEPAEVFVVEHEISMASAKKIARKLNVTLVPEPVGCDECSHKELAYCNRDIITDHCCCDSQEPFPYIPHTCYLGAERCRTVAEDCEEYMKIKKCCCDKILVEHYSSSGGNNNKSIFKSSINYFFSIIILIIVVACVITGSTPNILQPCIRYEHM